jgi:monoglucosyldiacylglycerol epimerase
MLNYLVEVLGTALSCNLVFDCLHYSLHQWVRSRWRLLRKFADWHNIHHQYFNGCLQLNPSLYDSNLFIHHLPEFCVHLMMIALASTVVSKAATLTVLGAYTVNFFRVSTYGAPNTPHHVDTPIAQAPQHSLLDSACYHAFHHLYPEGFFSSGTRLFDIIFGTGCVLRRRTFAVTGASGAFGQAMLRALQKAGAEAVLPLTFGVHYTEENLAESFAILKKADVLILMHGSSEDMQQSIVKSYIQMSEAFQKIHMSRQIPPEIWALGSELELLPGWNPAMREYRRAKLAFAAYAKACYDNPRLIYRHIVPSGFRTLAFPNRPVRAAPLVTMSLFLIRRGFCYIPATYTGIALLNYFRFRYWQGPSEVLL